MVATSLGNALEWFDISVYAYFAVYLSKAFFPTNDPTTSLLLTFGTFGLTFLARPIGGVLLGTYADRYGRKASLLLSIAMMTFGTLAVALMPTFDADRRAGAAARHRRAPGAGLFGRRRVRQLDRVPGRAHAGHGAALSQAGNSQARASARCSARASALLLTSTLSEADLQSWGWRIPFLFGVLIGPIGLYIRNNIEDATAPPADKDDTPVRNVFMDAEIPVLLGGRRDRDRDLGQLSHHLHADLCGQSAAPVADHRLSRGLCRRHRRHHAQSRRGSSPIGSDARLT